MGTFLSHKDASRIAWGVSDNNPSLEQKSFGALQRIADACEKMCTDRERLERDLKRAIEYGAAMDRRVACLRRSNASLRGQITKLQRKLKEKGE